MGSPQSIENKVRYSGLTLLGLLGATTPVVSQAKLYGSKKYASETNDRPPGTFDAPTKINAFGPLVNAGFRAKVNAGTVQTFIFKATDFANVNGPTTAEITTALNARLTGITAALEAGGHLSMRDSAAAATTSYLQLLPLTSNDSRYSDALPILGFVESECDIANFKLTAQLNTDARESVPPILATYDWVAATNVAGPTLATAPVVTFNEDTGLLSIVNALNANHTVQVVLS